MASGLGQVEMITVDADVRRTKADGGPVESARYWLDADRPGLELLRARFVTHAFPRHTHEDHFVLGVVEQGTQECRTAGRREDFPAGTVILLNPSVPHTGRSLYPEGYTYRALYPDLAFVERFQEARAGGKGMGMPPRFRSPYRFYDPALAGRLLRLHGVLESGAVESRLRQDTQLFVLMQELFERFGEARRGAESGDEKAGREPVAVRRVRSGWIRR